MNKNSILLVDDEDCILETFKFSLTKQGYQVHTAHNGEEGIRKFKEFKPDLVVTDLMMEGIGGIEVLKEVKRIKPDTMVIVLTGYGSLKSAVEALRLGAYDYMQKPCDRSEFSIKVAKCLDLLALQRQHQQVTEELVIANSKLIRQLDLRKQDQEKLEFYANELERSNQALGSFAAIASHDLKEPLRKIILFGDRLKEKYGDVLDHTGKDYLSRMQKSTQRMQQFIDDLLELSKITTRGKSFERVDLNQVVREVMEDLETRISTTGGTVHVESLPTLNADPLQMRQLFQNLIGNALKFHKEEEPPQVQVNSRPTHNGTWQITVQDNGIGFDEKYLHKIFMPFERLNGRSEFEGSGMGMAICKRIVERHKGTITANSQPGKGATFTFTMPEKQNMGLTETA